MGPAYRVPVKATRPASVIRITHENAELLRGGFDWLITTIGEDVAHGRLPGSAQPVGAISQSRAGLRVKEAVEFRPEAA